MRKKLLEMIKDAPLLSTEIEKLIMEQQWDKLFNEPIWIRIRNNKPVLFGDNTWDLSDLDPNQFETIKIRFNHPKIKISDSLLNEMKAFAYISIFSQNKKKDISSISSSIDILKRIAAGLTEIKVSSFSELSEDILIYLHELQKIDLKTKNQLLPINQMVKISKKLPFEMKIKNSLLVNELIDSGVTPSTQTPVIPLGIYLSLMETFSASVNHWLTHIDEIISNHRKLLEWQNNTLLYLTTLVRVGKLNLIDIFAYNSKDKKRIEERVKNIELEFQKRNIPIVDNLKCDQWLKVLELDCPTLNTKKSKLPEIELTLAGKKITRKEFKQLLVKLTSECIFLILALSGMRTDELANIHPDFGLQDIKIKNEKIHIFHTATNKITFNYKGNNDVFVTTETGSKAYRLLNAIHMPIRERMPKNDQKWMFFNLVRSYWLNRSKDLDFLFIKINKDYANSLLKMSDDDIANLKISDPNFEVPKDRTWHLTKHQLRRSLVFYLVGYSLADYPQLKRQLSHYSMAMTMYYGRNAELFVKLQQEIKIESARQKAIKIVGFYKKIANGERLAGGIGQQLYREYLSKPINETYKNRLMSVEYWQERILKGIDHLHVIAPGMYCTNNKCELRLEIDLSECVECEFDVIESAVYVESIRQESMRKLVLSEENNWLEPSLVTREFLKIRSSEKMLSVLNIPFDEYEPSPSIQNYLIEIKEDI